MTFLLPPRGKVTVMQLGSRRNYAVPLALHSRGLLRGLLTDFYLRRGSVLGSLAPRLPGFRGLRRRCHADLPESSVTSANGAFAARRMSKALGLGGGDEIGQWLATGEWFCRWAADRLPAGTEILYSYTSASLEAFRAGKAGGLRTVLDHATAPIRVESGLVAAAWERWPGWFDRPRPSPDEGRYADRQAAEWDLSDTILCGSAFLRDMVGTAGGPVGRCTIVPLGGDFTPPGPRASGEGKDGGLRVLFAGDDGLRKGFPDCIEACELAGISPERVRVAGAIRFSIEGEGRARTGATLLGRIGRESLMEEFQRADVLVLPTVSDTFGMVVLEAMSRGCIPVVTDRAGAADVIEDGRSGFVVPVHSPGAIAERLTGLENDRQLRLSMSEAALARSKDCSLDRYGERLAAAVLGEPGLIA